jgi:DNA polymerase III alpha subunit
MLFEDESGTVNLIVPPPVYDRYRALVRAAPLLRARGRLQRREGTTNVLVDEVAALERGAVRGPVSPPPQPSSSRRNRERAVAELREVAPAGHSFGRRR